MEELADEPALVGGDRLVARRATSGSTTSMSPVARERVAGVILVRLTRFGKMISWSRRPSATNSLYTTSGTPCAIAIVGNVPSAATAASVGGQQLGGQGLVRPSTNVTPGATEARCIECAAVADGDLETASRAGAREPRSSGCAGVVIEPSPLRCVGANSTRLASLQALPERLQVVGERPAHDVGLRRIVDPAHDLGVAEASHEVGDSAKSGSTPS